MMLLDRFHNKFHHHPRHSGRTTNDTGSSEASPLPPPSSSISSIQKTDLDKTPTKAAHFKIGTSQKINDGFVQQTEPELQQNNSDKQNNFNPLPTPISTQSQLLNSQYNNDNLNNTNMAFDFESGNVMNMDPRINTPIMTPITYGSNSNNYFNNPSGSFVPPYLNNNINNNNLNRTRQNSSVSLASSISDYPMNSLRQQVATNNNNAFSDSFIQLLMEIYQYVCSDPTTTPFDSLNPPSGILNKVAKISIEQAELKNIEIGQERNSWLITLVRYRLLQEVRKDGYLSRNASLSSLPPPPQFAELMNLSNSNYNNNKDSNDLITNNTATNVFPLRRPNLISRPNTPQLLIPLEKSYSNTSGFHNDFTTNNTLSMGLNSLNLNQNFLARQCSRTSSPLPLPLSNNNNINNSFANNNSNSGMNLNLSSNNNGASSNSNSMFKR
ncbi:Cip1p NDAI_0C06190 [Naumovozyma dairenensis CBS 421]|uniref:Uncharacterized protein n=1 Tax=Naumovozyma dairenensis (strain ATCC 10597 / BCRC 20456 / CBS 421 / NBRC 0211 / NRRL Y-12639) TaxID=1071378 RepID=G0W917_NAUDC|nr:hypothetical protein NDAI_0C06190 [Naumovozyma dairenensis CBS 421]CCD24278.1 hypothetical protein NDAI_0C06190 [Naumovozyma dairenensis CBS 421]